MNYEIFVGSKETMNSIAQKGARALNPKTHKWQIIDKDAKYNVVEDNKGNGGATLFSDKPLREIAEEKGLII